MRAQRTITMAARYSVAKTIVPFLETVISLRITRDESNKGPPGLVLCVP